LPGAGATAVRREGGQDRPRPPRPRPALSVLGPAAAPRVPRGATAPAARRPGGQGGHLAGAAARVGGAAQAAGGGGARPDRPGPVRQTRTAVRSARDRVIEARRDGAVPGGWGPAGVALTFVKLKGLVTPN